MTPSSASTPEGQGMTSGQIEAAREYLRPERAVGWKDLPLFGRRRSDVCDGVLPGDLQFGDYWRTNGIWTVYIPGGPVSTLPNHHVEEHKDGTISVEPGGGGISNSIPGHNFHGYIRHGVWTTS